MDCCRKCNQPALKGLLYTCLCQYHFEVEFWGEKIADEVRDYREKQRLRLQKKEGDNGSEERRVSYLHL